MICPAGQLQEHDQDLKQQLQGRNEKQWKTNEQPWKNNEQPMKNHRTPMKMISLKNQAKTMVNQKTKTKPNKSWT